MSTCRRCDIWKATDGKWYMILGDGEHAYEDYECTTYGTFEDEEAVHKYISRNHSNPGGATIDDSGTEEPPKEFEDVNRQQRFGFGYRFR